MKIDAYEAIHRIEQRIEEARQDAYKSLNLSFDDKIINTAFMTGLRNAVEILEQLDQEQRTKPLPKTPVYHEDPDRYITKGEFLESEG